MAKIKPTHKEPLTPQSKEFEKDFKKAMVTHDINITEVQKKINEIDEMLGEAEQSLKKKIFSLPKMEALVFSDPKLSAIYDEMAENGEEKYGYHYNETIQNMIFNDYVLNSPHYLQKYKNAIPKEKKRRDKSGINQLKKAGKKKMDATGTKLDKKEKVDESTASSSSGSFSTKAGDKNNYEANQIDTEREWKNLIEPEVSEIANEKKMKDKKKSKPKAFDNDNYVGGSSAKPTWKGGKIVKNNNNTTLNESSTNNFEEIKQKAQRISKEEGVAQHVNKISDNNYQVSDWYDNDSTIISYENGEELNETTSASSAGGANGYVGYAGPAAFSNKGDLMGDSKTPEKIRKPIANIASISESNYLTDTSGFEKYIEELNEEIDSFETIDEKSKSKSQQKFMGMVHAYQKGELDDNDVSDEVIKAANSMSDKDAEDFASTKHKGLPDKVNEELYDKIVKIEFYDKSGQLQTLDGETIPLNQLNSVEKPIKLTFTDGSEERVSYDEFNEIYLNQQNINEILSQHDTVEYLSDRKGEEPFMMGDEKWQFVNAKYPDGKVDIGVYRFGHDLVYDYSKWMEEYNINENNIKEDMQTMIQNNGTSMSNKSQATGDQSSEVPQGAQQTGGLQESEMNLLEELNKELEAFSIHHDKLKAMNEERKTNSQIINARVGDENAKNFKKDFKNSDTKDVINVEKELQYKDQQTDVGDPQKLGDKIEKQEIKNADMKSEEAFKNVGNSTNNEGDEIPKRNMTSDEQEEVNMFRNGQHSIVYDNEPDERFTERQKADQGDFYDIGEKQKEFKAKAPTYNKDSQPIDDGIDKVQFDKDKSGWNERDGIKESMVTGRYIDVLGKRRLIEFRLNEVNDVEKLDEGLMKMSFDGLGNTYLNKSVNKKVVVNEAVVDAMNKHSFYTDGENVFAIKNSVKPLNESKEKEEKTVVNEEINKMKHLLGYKPDSFVSTKNVKKNRGF